jgi:hypothetical protein
MSHMPGNNMLDITTPQGRLALVKEDGNAIKFFVDSATAEDRLIAIKQNGRAIEFFF